VAVFVIRIQHREWLWRDRAAQARHCFNHRPGTARLL
jgi:hypothetical protein